MLTEDKEVFINSIMISDGAVEISFVEKRDNTTTKVGLVKTIVLERSSFVNLIEELEEVASDLVDAGLLELRQPPEHLGGRRRRREPADEPDEG